MDAWLSILGLAIGLLGCWLAGRSWAAARRLALEMIQLRARLSRAEEGAGGQGWSASPAAQARAVSSAALSGRLDHLERELREVRLRAANALPVAAASAQPVDDVHERLLRQGYAAVAVLDRREDGAWLVEAERDGIVLKGWALPTQAGGVELSGVSSVRAFP